MTLQKRWVGEFVIPGNATVQPDAPRIGTAVYLAEEADYELARLDWLVAEQKKELQRFKDGGVTEAMLRKQDGYLKLDLGCVVVLASDYEIMKRQLAEATALVKDLAALLQEDIEAFQRNGGQFFDAQRFESAPCYLCGYTGEEYYQPRSHACAERYHAEKERQP